MLFSIIVVLGRNVQKIEVNNKQQNNSKELGLKPRLYWLGYADYSVITIVLEVSISDTSKEMILLEFINEAC